MSAPRTVPLPASDADLRTRMQRIVDANRDGNLWDRYHQELAGYVLQLLDRGDPPAPDPQLSRVERKVDILLRSGPGIKRLSGWLGDGPVDLDALP